MLKKCSQLFQKIPGIAQAMLAIFVCTALVRVISLLKEFVLAYKIGTSDSLDSFYIALFIPYFFINLFSQSLHIVVIPFFIKIKEEQGEPAAFGFVRSIFFLSAAALLFISWILIAVVPHFYSLFFSFSQEKMQQIQIFFFFLLPLLFLQGMAHLFSHILYANANFKFPSLIPMATPFIAMVSLILSKEGCEVHALIFSVLLGALIELILLALALKKLGFSFFPLSYFVHPQLQRAGKQYCYVVVAVFFLSMTSFVEQAMAGTLEVGSISALNYGSKIPCVVLVILGAMSNSLLPYLSAMVAQADWSGLSQILKFYARGIFVLTIPMTMVLFFSSYWIVHILLERGKFLPSTTLLVSQIQAFYFLQIPLYLLETMGSRVLNALSLNFSMARIAVFNLFCHIFCCVFLAHCLGVPGIALAIFPTRFFSCVQIFFCIKKNLRKLKTPLLPGNAHAKII